MPKTGAAPPRESALARSALRYLSTQGSHVRVRKVHGSRFSTAGDPDLYGCCRGRMFVIELKQAGKQATAKQRHELDGWKATGAVVGVATTLEEVEAILVPFGVVTLADWRKMRRGSPVRTR